VQGQWTTTIAITGFVVVAIAQVTNMILARALAGTVPPFSLAFFRWAIIAVGLAPFVLDELKAHRRVLLDQTWGVLAAGFLGMFLCGAPIYEAGVSTTAISIALIMAMSPIVVLLISWLMGLERISAIQLTGMALALAGALLIISRGDPRTLLEVAAVRGDLLVLVAMLGWSGYTLLQSRVATDVSFLGRICVFAGAGALMSLPFSVAEAWAAPSSVFNWRAAGAYLFAGMVPGILAYAGFAYLGGKFGSVRTSLVMYIGPIASAAVVRPACRAADGDPRGGRRADSCWGVGEPQEVSITPMAGPIEAGSQ
jgi:drug/metabolite transporter (DMT)-like permease